MTVTVNGMTATTDEEGRYIVSGFSAVRKQVFVKTSRDGYPDTPADSTNNDTENHPNPVPEFAANTVELYDIDIYGSNTTLTISGTVTETGTGTPIKGVEILVDGKDPLNATGAGRGRKLVTVDDGTYTAVVEARGLGQTSSVTAKKTGMSFTPNPYPVPSTPGGNFPGINFTGFTNATISGRVVAPGGGRMAGVIVRARTGIATGAVADSVITTSTGTFALKVSWGSFTITAEVADDPELPGEESDEVKASTIFTYPALYAGGVIGVGPSQTVTFGDITAKSFRARKISATRVVTDLNKNGNGLYSGDVQVNLEYDVDAVNFDNAAQEVTVEACTEDDREDCTWNGGNFSPSTGQTPTSRNDAQATGKRKGTITLTGNLQTDSVVHIRVTSTSGSLPAGTPLPAGAGGTPTAYTYSTVAEVNTKASVKATRGVSGTGAAATDTLGVTWTAKTNARTQQRVVLQVEIAGQAEKEWLVFTDATSNFAVATTSDAVDGDRRNDDHWAWVLDIGAHVVTRQLPRADGSASFTVTKEALLKALVVRVESEQADDFAGATWKEPVVAGTASVAAKPSG